MNTYRTAKIAKLIGVHPNTVRFYEKMKLLPVIPRTKNGYRIFNDSHLAQLRLLRVAFRAEIMSDKLRQEVYKIIKIVAIGDINSAYQDTINYLSHIREEKTNAEEAIHITLDIIKNTENSTEYSVFYGRPKVSEVFGISIDVLRDWERNGLIKVPKYQNKRRFTVHEINRLKIIKTLRNAHYSMMSILRMLNHLDQGEINIRKVINTPDKEENIVNATDRYITALSQAEKDALEMLKMLNDMKKS